MSVCFAMLWVSGCATTGTVTKTRDLNETVERAQTPETKLTATLQPYGDTVEAKLIRETAYITFNKVQIRTARKYENGTKPALVWGGFGVATALTGLAVRYGETQQAVERASYVNGGGTQTPEISYRTRPAKSRVASSTFFISGGVLCSVGLGQLAAPLLPATKVDKTIHEQYLSSRVAALDVSQSTVSLSIGATEVTSVATDSAGRAILPLQDVLSITDWSERSEWSWTGTVRAQDTSVEVDLRNSEAVGTAAGEWLHGQIKSGDYAKAKKALFTVEPHRKAYLPAWDGFCNAAKPVVSTLDSPTVAKELRPEPVGQICAAVITAIENRASVQIRAALKDKDTARAQSWLNLAAADKQEKLSSLIGQKREQIEAAELAAERALLRRQRQTWKSRTDHALATCSATHREIERRKSKVQQLSYAGQVGRAQTELERLQEFMASTGEPDMSRALEEIRTIKDEMDDQGISNEIQIPWMRRVGGACGG